MQLIFLPHGWMIVPFFLGWLVIQLCAAAVGRLIPDRFLKGSLFERCPFETERFYRKYFKVHLWKKLLPDGAAITKGGFRKKCLASPNSAYLSNFITESKRAEVVHWAAMFPFWVFGFWSPPIVIPFMLLYALAANMPCIIAQRYNRPRLEICLSLARAREAKKTLDIPEKLGD